MVIGCWLPLVDHSGGGCSWVGASPHWLMVLMGTCCCSLVVLHVHGVVVTIHVHGGSPVAVVAEGGGGSFVVGVGSPCCLYFFGGRGAAVVGASVVVGW